MLSTSAHQNLIIQDIIQIIQDSLTYTVQTVPQTRCSLKSASLKTAPTLGRAGHKSTFHSRGEGGGASSGPGSIPGSGGHGLPTTCSKKHFHLYIIIINADFGFCTFISHPTSLSKLSFPFSSSKMKLYLIFISILIFKLLLFLLLSLNIFCYVTAISPKQYNTYKALSTVPSK